MEIGILTYHSAHNYGAMLQAYALQTKLEGLGHGAKFVHYHSDSLELKNQRKQKVCSLRQAVVKLAVILLRKMFVRRYDRFNMFLENYLKHTRRYKSIAELNSSPPDFDAFVCGSDQVWNMGCGGEPAFFLRFPVAEAKKISYAASFGSGSVPEEYQKKLVKWLAPFDSISVRESSGVRIVKEVADRDAQLVMDPVFLLPSNEWNKIVHEPELSGNYILFYSLEPSSELSDILKHLSKRLNMPIVVLGKGGSFVLTCKIRMAIDSGPAEFLGWFKNASFVVTNSFHATSFAIIYKLPFLAVPHSTRNARMESLLELTGLMSRQVKSVPEVEEMNNDELMSVDYTVVQRRVDSEVKRSVDFIHQALER